jgi:hypothetical protein
MLTSNRSVSRPWSKRVSLTSRTAVYGPVCTVVWEGWSREAPPYPDLWHFSECRNVRLESAMRFKTDIPQVLSLWSHRNDEPRRPTALP